MLPILYQNHNFILYSYPLLMGIGWGIGYQIFFSLSENQNHRRSLILFWGIFLSAWIGAKLLFYLTFPKEGGEILLSELSFWTGGGFVFYGGLLGGLLYIGVFHLIAKLKISELWPMIPALTIGHAIGRIGCFLAGCCYGAPTDSAWGIHLHGEFRHPTQIIESLGLFIIGIILLYSKRAKTSLIAFYFLAYGFLRFGVESLRGDVIRGQWGVLTPSQWISLFMILVGIILSYRQFQRSSVKIN